jgi:pyroglutamyl-peptidase
MWVFQIRSQLQFVIVIGVLFGAMYIPSTMGVPSIHTSVDDVQTIYLTGFGPFLNFTENPSELIVDALNQTTVEDYRIQGRVLPVNFTEAPRIIREDIERFDPDLIVCLGLDANSKGLTLELIGMNLQYNPVIEKPLTSLKRIQKDGPFIIPTRLDVWQMYQRLKEDDIPVSLSMSAGLYVCNTVFYETLYYLQEESLDTPMGFIHVPPIQHDNTSGMKFDAMVDGIITILLSNIN